MPKVPSNIHHGRTVPSPYETAPSSHHEHSSFRHTPPSSQQSSAVGALGGSPSQDTSSNAPTPSKDSSGRSVVSSACLSCRAAKRRCDGERPICTPCIQRGATPDMAPEAGGCHYVASKRGGPRYKGVRGAAAVAKTEQRKMKKQALATAKSGGESGAGSDTSMPPSASSMREQGNFSGDSSEGMMSQAGANAARDVYMHPLSAPQHSAYGHPADGTRPPPQMSTNGFLPPTVPSSTMHRIGAPTMHLPQPHALRHPHAGQERDMYVGPGPAHHHHVLPPPVSTGMVRLPPALGSAGPPENITPAMSLLHMSGSATSASSQPGFDRGSGSPAGAAAERGHGIGYPPHNSGNTSISTGGHHSQGWRTSTFPPTSAASSHVRTGSYSSSSGPHGHLQQTYPPVSLPAPNSSAAVRNSIDYGNNMSHRNFPISPANTWTTYSVGGASPASLTSGVAMMNTGSGRSAGSRMSVSHNMPAPISAASSAAVPHSNNAPRPSSGHLGPNAGYSNMNSAGPSPTTTIISMPHQTMVLPIPEVYADSMTLVGDLSYEKLEMWSKLQQYQLPASNTAAAVGSAAILQTASTSQGGMPLGVATATNAQHSGSAQGRKHADGTVSPTSMPHDAHIAFSEFLQKLETLPKAGVIGGAPHEGGEHGDEHHHHAGGFGHGGGMVGMDENDDSDGGGRGGVGGSGESGIGDGEGSDGAEGRGRLRGTFDTERRVKALLTDYYQLVYPASPVMLPPTHLSSLTFHYCESGPNALHAAISASIAQHLTDSEAQKTLQEDAALSLALSLGKRGGPAELTRLEVAAHHAASAEMLLISVGEQLANASGGTSGPGSPHGLGVGGAHQQGISTASPGSVSTAGGVFASNPFRSAPPDLELVLIEYVAARVLLSQYYYGQCGHRGHKLGYTHALRAWESAQSLVLTMESDEGPKSEAMMMGSGGGGGGNGGSGESGSGSTGHMMAPGGFSQAQKVEWGRRTYHTCFSAVVVLATTGGFEPVQAAQTVLTALQTRPSLGNDDAAWGTLIRGSHYVCATYQALYDLESLRRGDAASFGTVVRSQADAYGVRNEIFARMSHLDVDMANYCVYDPEWAAGQRGGAAGGGPGLHFGSRAGRGGTGEGSRSATDSDFDADEGAPVFAVQVEKELARSLKIAGKLMTAGSMIILHRAQAFGNARLFMDTPHCGLPAFNTKDDPLALGTPKDTQDPNHEDDALWHRSNHREGSPTDSTATSTFSGSAVTTTESGSLFAPTQTSSAATHSTATSTSGSVSSSMVKPNSLLKSATTSQSASSHGSHGGATGSSTGSGATGGSVPAKMFFPPDDRYLGGPFDAKVSLQRCKLAAAVMHETYLTLEREKEREMASSTGQRRRLSLTPVPRSDNHSGGTASRSDSTISAGTNELTRTREGEATPRLPPYSACSYVLSAYVWLMLSLLALLGNDDREQAAQQIEVLRSRARSIHTVLERMSASWRNAREYRAEVETLLLANERLAG
ncbi:hypothetical protein CF319_g1429 [Tilletia indica]|nr:hypothetical protein CF319_g1429 [Tilletia indica]